MRETRPQAKESNHFRRQSCSARQDAYRAEQFKHTADNHQFQVTWQIIRHDGNKEIRPNNTLIGEFKEFAFQGNLIDMALGVIIGGPFGKLLDSLVKNIIMPAISLTLPGDQGYVDWKLTIGQKTIPCGLFLGEVVSFLLIAVVLFIFMVKIVGWFSRTKEAKETAPAPLTKDQQLLSEIRDLLSKQPESAV